MRKCAAVRAVRQTCWIEWAKQYIDVVPSICGGLAWLVYLQIKCMEMHVQEMDVHVYMSKYM